MRISDWSSDVCSSDLRMAIVRQRDDGSRRDPIGCGMTKRVNLILQALLMLAALLALTVGPDGVSPRLLADAIGGGEPAAAIIILDIRMPRIVAAAVVGAALVRHSTLMNPRHYS